MKLSLKSTLQVILDNHPNDILLCFRYSENSQKLRNDLTKYSFKLPRSSYGQDAAQFISESEFRDFLFELNLIVIGDIKDDCYFQVARSPLTLKVVADFINAAGKRIACFHAIDSEGKTQMEIDFEDNWTEGFKSNGAEEEKCDWFIKSCSRFLSRKAENNS